jgi:hypothetical protein
LYANERDPPVAERLLSIEVREFYMQILMLINTSKKSTIDWLSQNYEAIYSKAAQTWAYLTAAVLSRMGIAGAALTWFQNECTLL